MSLVWRTGALETHLEVPRCRKEAIFHLREGVHIDPQILVPKDSPFSRLEVVMHDGGEGRGNHVRTKGPNASPVCPSYGQRQQKCHSPQITRLRSQVQDETRQDLSYDRMWLFREQRFFKTFGD